MALKLADLNGYPVPAPPAQLPPYEGRPPSPAAAVRDANEKIWPSDPDYRVQSTSLNPESSFSGSPRDDKVLAARKIFDFAKKEGIVALTDLGPKILHKIAFHWLPLALASRGMSRQARIAAAIEQGRLQAAQTPSGDPAQ